MTDIVKRLREWPNAEMMREKADYLMSEAADEIERLRANNKTMADVILECDQAIHKPRPLEKAD